MRVRLETAHGTFLRAGDTGEINQATQPGPWEWWDIRELGDDRVHLVTAHGTYISEVDGQLRAVDPGQRHQALTFERLPQSDGTVRYRTDDGRYLRAGDKGDVNLVGEAGRWESFLEMPGDSKPTGAPSLLDLPFEQRVGNFLYPQDDGDQFFGPACLVKGEKAFRRRCAWVANHGYRLILVNLVQDDWGRTRGRPGWTSPQLLDPYGGDMDEAVRLLDTARTQYGLNVVIGLFDQEHLHDLDTTRSLIAEHVPRLNDVACAYWTGWEINEVIEVRAMHRLSRTMAEHATKPHGLHFGSFRDDRPEPWWRTRQANDFWRENQSTLVWMQYGFDTPTASIAERTRRLAQDLDGQQVVCAEHSVAENGHSLAEATQRGEEGIRGGAIARLNG